MILITNIVKSKNWRSNTIVEYRTLVEGEEVNKLFTASFEFKLIYILK